jgi:phosphoenolpyruvate carboxykinase (GTP)
MASETTAAAVGQMGVVRRDPMAMKPFCGYNFADYWNHWLSFAQRTTKLPRIFHVNWFRQDAHGRFLWPGFGENLRVLRWIADRCEGRAAALDTPIGYVPTAESLDLRGLDIDREALSTLLSVNSVSWRLELDAVAKYLDEFGARLPQQLRDQLNGIRNRLNATQDRSLAAARG